MYRIRNTNIINDYYILEKLNIFLIWKPTSHICDNVNKNYKPTEFTDYKYAEEDLISKNKNKKIIKLFEVFNSSYFIAI